MTINNNIINEIDAIDEINNVEIDMIHDVEFMENGFLPYPVDDDAVPLFIDDEIEVILDQAAVQNAVNNMINAGNVPAGQDDIIDNFMWIGD